ncbi:MAG: hypothetical protein IID46_09065 [Planctomycetes bacterium]|nr:hypothetical protein [Planctomycetota bacterium]
MSQQRDMPKGCVPPLVDVSEMMRPTEKQLDIQGTCLECGGTRHHVGGYWRCAGCDLAPTNHQAGDVNDTV